MPNHIINKLFAPDEVIAALAGPEDIVDFRQIIPEPEGLYPGEPFDENRPELGYGVCGSTEMALEAALGIGRGIRPTAPLERTERNRRVFMRMTESYFKTGYLQSMAFARECWGTKWNAYSAKLIDGGVEFQTAWNAPRPVYDALAARFPQERFDVFYADEDRGSNCAYLIYDRGELVEEEHLGVADVALLWGDKPLPGLADRLRGSA